MFNQLKVTTGPTHLVEAELWVLHKDKLWVLSNTQELGRVFAVEAIHRLTGPNTNSSRGTAHTHRTGNKDRHTGQKQVQGAITCYGKLLL